MTTLYSHRNIWMQGAYDSSSEMMADIPFQRDEDPEEPVDGKIAELGYVGRQGLEQILFLGGEEVAEPKNG